jgi:hypothetical protein
VVVGINSRGAVAGVLLDSRLQSHGFIVFPFDQNEFKEAEAGVGLWGACLLGVMTVDAAAQASGPSCLRIVEFGEVGQFFLLPTGGGQAILTGQSLTFGDAYSGSGYLLDSDFIFTLVSGRLPGVLEGILHLDTGEGAGTVTYADTRETQALRLAVFPPPCLLP